MKAKYLSAFKPTVQMKWDSVDEQVFSEKNYLKESNITLLDVCVKGTNIIPFNNIIKCILAGYNIQSIEKNMRINVKWRFFSVTGHALI